MTSDRARQEMTQVRAWLMAIRPRTLPAGAAPVLLGGMIAAMNYGWQAWSGRWGLCLAVALLLQIAANLANDYFDGIQRVDRSDRIGPVRVTQTGLLAPARVLAATVLCLMVAGVLGLIAVWLTSWYLLAVGALCLVFAVGYTAGPLPLARIGLGELAALLFFGWVPCVGTCYVITGELSRTALELGAIPGFYAAAILAVNNLRDIQTDAAADKRTLAVRFGERFARAECVLLIIAGSVMAAAGSVLLGSGWYLVALVPLALRAKLLVNLAKQPISREFNKYLAQTAQLELMTVVVMIGVMLVISSPCPKAF